MAVPWGERKVLCADGVVRTNDEIMLEIMASEPPEAEPDSYEPNFDLSGR